MSMILLHNPVASSPELRRVHMFAGRHLGEQEFDREQAYADARLAPLLQHRPAGVVQGLELQLGPNGIQEPGFNLSNGLALAGNGQVVGLSYPLYVFWRDLIDAYLAASGAADAVGVYYLLLTRSEREIDAPGVDACQRLDLDPTRDSRRVLAGRLVLQRLNVSADAANNWQHERIQNWIVADRVDGKFLGQLGLAVPLALLAIERVPADAEAAEQPYPYRLKWLAPESGRYEAVANTGYRVLLNQTVAAMREVMQAAVAPDNETPLAQFLQDHLHLDFLPAAGQLPLSWLQNPETTAPSLLWLPPHLGVDMIPVPEEAVGELLNRHIARRVIDLRQPAGDKIRLLLAVNEPDYRADLLDIPATDAVLQSDIFRFYMRAYEAWRKWRKQFDVLYFLEPADTPPLDGEIAEIERRVLDPAQFKHLDLPKPEFPPLVPTLFFDGLIARAAAALQDPANPGTPYPYSEGPPDPPAFYGNWLVEGNPPRPDTPDEDGLLVQYAVALTELEAIENQVRALRRRLEKSRDFMLLQRQQLDSQTVALAALAGGVAGDGTGLQVARWLPYAKLNVASIEEAPDTGNTPQAAVAVEPKSAFVMTAGRTASKAVNTSVLGNSLLNNALLSTATAGKTNVLLNSRPQTFSAFELGINKSRLEMLAQLSKEAVSKPAFQAKEYRFGVIDHINPEINEYAKAYYGMKELLSTLTDLFDRTDAARLRKQLVKIGEVEEGETLPNDPFQRPNKLERPDILDKLAERDATDPRTKQLNTEKYSLLRTQYRYHALFKAGKILTQWIAVFEPRYNNLERSLQGKLREQANKHAQIEKLAGLIRVARETLESLDRFRIEQLGDYGVAQRLVDEDWRKVFALNKERRRILTTGVLGLYYVRVRGTPVSASLADPLALRHGAAKDIVPGCDGDEEVELPAVLQAFFAAVCEIPMDDWTALQGLQAKLPAFQQFEYLEHMRQARFQARPAKLEAPGSDTLKARLQTVHLQNQAVMQQWATFKLPAFAVSSVKTQAEAAKVLSLEDLAVGNGSLRKPAQALREQLEHCLACLLENLNQLPPSLRLQWGQLAEDDRIKVEDVSWWPGLERAETEDFNAARTVSELIAWWFRQLAAEASASSRSAMRNMIRATLIQASLGDPQEIIRGNVHVPPRLASIGERLQVKLNRAPQPGTQLQLLDVSQRVVALLAVEDHGPQSTQVKIIDMVPGSLTIDSRFSVVSNKNTRLRL